MQKTIILIILSAQNFIRKFSKWDPRIFEKNPQNTTKLLPVGR